MFSKIIIFLTLLLVGPCTSGDVTAKISEQETLNQMQDQDKQSEIDYLTVPQQMLEAIRDGQPTESYEKILEEADLDELSRQLDTDIKKKTFWVNAYNAYVQTLLVNNPELFTERGDFFKAKQITIAQELISLDKMEHGIIRGSRNKLTLGLTKKIFVSDYEKKLRVKKRDGRVHFALNCGAISCPPIAIYEADRLDEQFDASSKKFLMETTTYNAENNEAEVVALFSWFRFDFGGKKGIINKYLKGYDIIPEDAKPSLSYSKYDWTLSTGNYIDL